MSKTPSFMLRHLLFGLCLLLVVIGCSGGETGKVDENYLKDAEAQGKARREIFVKVNGDYDALSAEDKEAYVKTFKGDETQARRFWDLMKNPPSSSGPPIPGQMPGGTGGASGN